MMKKYIKVYLKGMQIGVCENFEDMGVMCEWCGQRPAVDIHHLDGRKSGGSKLKDTVENLMALCREDHISAERRLIQKDALKERHLSLI